MLDKGLINFRALRLAVRTVCAGFAVQRRALIKGEVKRGEGVNNRLHAALDLTFAVSVLNAQIEYAARLMCQTFVYERTV